MTGYEAAWVGWAALIDMVDAMSEAGDGAAAYEWIAACLETMPRGSGLDWAAIDLWSAGIVRDVAASPDEARDAWVARALASLGMVHDPEKAALGWKQSTPSARGLWQAAAVSTGSRALAARDGWRKAHPELAQAADLAAAGTLPEGARIGDPLMPDASIRAQAVEGEDPVADGVDRIKDGLKNLWETQRAAVTLATGAAIVVVGLEVWSMARKRKTSTRRTTRRRRTTPRKPQPAGIGAGAAGVATGAVLGAAYGAMSVRMVDTKEADPKKAGSIVGPVVGAVIGTAAGLGGALIPGVGGGAVSGAGDGLLGAATSDMARGYRGRAAAKAARLAQSDDATDRAWGAQMLSSLSKKSTDGDSKTAGVRRLSPKALAAAQEAAAVRLGLRNAGLVAGAEDALRANGLTDSPLDAAIEDDGSRYL